jgi:hypothetical protein
MLIYRRFKLQNHLTEVTPKIQKIADYEKRMEQDMELLRKWYVTVLCPTVLSAPRCRMVSSYRRNQDVERVKMAETARNEYRARLVQMETVLRAVEKEKNEQAEIVRYVYLLFFLLIYGPVCRVGTSVPVAWSLLHPLQ